MKLFNKKEELNHQPIPRGFYAFNSERAGDFLIFVEAQTNHYKFLYVPGTDPFYLTPEDFTESIKRGVLSFVEELPEEIFQESLALSCPSKKEIVSLK
jgi:hypothetical protein